MRWLILAMSGILLMTAFSYAQVDTLQLVEIGSIEAPAEINELYIEDLDGDSLKEIILTTAANVHIYNGLTYEPIWTSPALDHPRDLVFADIDNDGLIDFSVKDDAHIYIFDPHDSGQFWSSPTIQLDVYRCYTLGYMEPEDEWPDVLIVTKQPFQGLGIDTVWIDGYSGPTFDDHYQFMTGVIDVYSFDDGYYWLSREQPSKLISAGSIKDNLAWNRSFIFTDWFREEGYYEPDGYIEWMRQLYHGKVKCFDTTNNDEIGAWNVGGIIGYGTTELDDRSLIYMISQKRHFYDSQYLTFDEHVKYLNFFTADSLISTDTLWIDQNLDWQGFIVEDLNYEIPGDEFGYASGDTLYLFTFPDMNLMYIRESIAGIIEIISVYRFSSYFNMPQILCSMADNDYRFALIDGGNGNITVIYTGRHQDIITVSDLDIDGDDELISIDNSLLSICGLGRTGIVDESSRPVRPFLVYNYPNPFNSSTTIEYSLPEAGEVTVEVFDLLGRKVETLVNEKQAAGAYKINWNADNQASGIYFYRIEAGDYQDTRRMMLLK